MNFFRSTLTRFLNLFRNRSRHERELTDELASHLQLHIDDNLRRGLSPDEARRQALLQLGGLEQTKESVREQRSLPFFETLFRDLRYAFLPSLLSRPSPSLSASVPIPPSFLSSTISFSARFHSPSRRISSV